jgi:hypothetical protein
MRPIPFQGFIGGAYKAGSWKASTQRCVNLYLEDDPEKGAVLYGTPGHTTLDTFGAAPVLAMEATPSGLLVVTGDGVYWASSVENGAFVGKQTISSTASGYAICAQAGDQILMVNGDAGYAIDRVSQTFTPVPVGGSSGFPVNPQSCASVDGYFLAHGPDSDVFFWSTPFDPLTWDALDFASAENLNDKLRRIIVVERDIYLIGELSTEIWASVGGDTVFERIEGTFIPHGTIAPLSAARLDRSVIFLSQDSNGGAVVIMARGLQSQRISTHAIETEISSYAVTGDAYAITYQQRGHPFYCLTFPTQGKTWVYDLATQLWHERSSRVQDPFQPGTATPISYVDAAWLARCHAYFGGINMIGSRIGPQVSRLDPRIASENGVDVVRVRTSPHVTDNEEDLTLSVFEVVFQPGVGNGTGVGPSNDPKARLRISRDGGQTYGPAREVSIGKQGDYIARAKWNRCGRARDFVAEVIISAQVPVAISKAVMTLTR